MRINTNQYSINFQEKTPDRAALTVGEFFAGGGGFTTGLNSFDEIQVKWICNHDKVALRTNAYWQKGVKVYWANFLAQDEHELERVDIVHASTECDEHSDSNPGPVKDMASYMMGFELIRYIKYLQPLLLTVENVPAVLKWGPVDGKGRRIKERQGEYFEKWVKEIKALGYEYKQTIRNAADDGLPTRRVRYFGYFYRPGIAITIPEQTHARDGKDGLKKWVPCGPLLDLDNKGHSIFGREFNMNLPKAQRKPLVHNSKRRIAAGIRKLHPEVHQFLCHYYGGTDANRFQRLDQPVNAITTNNRHQLITLEKMQFLTDHVHTDYYDPLDEPMRPQLTWQTKQVITSQFLCQYYGGSDQTQALKAPINTIPCRDTHQLVSIRLEKIQFIATYFNSNGDPGQNVSSLKEPLPPILTEPKHQLVTVIDDFDVFARFLTPEELGRCSTFPEGYFTSPDLKLSHKDAVRMIGNAVPPEWAEVVIGPNIEPLIVYKDKLKAA